jgi:hypothetical protein
VVLDLLYPGTLALGGVSHIQIFEGGNPSGSQSAPNQGLALVTTLSMPDLETTHWFSVDTAANLKNIDLPKLRTANGLTLRQTGLKTISLPSLENVSVGAQFEGEFDV